MDIHTVEDTLSRVPIIRPPKEVYIFDKVNPERPGDMYDLYYDPGSGRISSDSFFDLQVFHHNAMNDGRWIVRGMTPSDRSEAIYTTDSTNRTIVHEPLHSMGAKSEAVVRPLAAIATMRAKMNMGLIKRNVKYEEVPMSREEKLSYMKSRGITPKGNTDWPIKKYRLVR